MRRVLLWLSACSFALVTCAELPAQTELDQRLLQQTVASGLEYLRTQGMEANGAVSPRVGIGITALAASAMMQNGLPPSDPAVARAVRLVSGSARDDGGIYADDSRLKMYETCVAIMCLEQANQQGQFDEILQRAARYVKGEQFDESRQTEPSDREYGGVGYGGTSRPDLSNTAYFIEALESLGNPDHDEAIQKALIFVSRCQNLESEYNTAEHAAKINDGGFYYNVTDGGGSAAGETPEGGLRSYGSMTYAGFKSMLHAGLEPDDPRVRAAREWIEQHYTVKENPGLGDAGLYYYYHLFAKALDTAGIDQLTDAEGVQHNWRAELVAHLSLLQAADGSWTNSNRRWMESDPNLATTFSLLALSHCRAKGE